MARTLLSPQRRFLALALIAALVAPAAAMPFLPFKIASPEENRNLAPVPSAPRNLAEARTAPRAVDAFLADHFGFREPMMQTAGVGWRQLGGRTVAPGAVEGRDGWLFLTEGLRESTGQVLDRRRATDYGAFVCEAAARLKAQGIEVAFGLAPSPAGIYPEKAPAWAGPAQRPTEYDLVLEKARACSVSSVDLRPLLIGAKDQGPMYRRQDSHWTLRGSLIAYNAMVGALGRPDWRVSAQDLRWPMDVVSDGDLPRLAGLQPKPERIEIHDRTGLPPGATKTPLQGLSFVAAAPFVIETGKPGPTVLIVGDSFTETMFPPYLAPFVGRVAFVHQDQCGLDWRVIEQVKPDHVLLVPAERAATCLAGRPKAWAAKPG